MGKLCTGSNAVRISCSWVLMQSGFLAVRNEIEERKDNMADSNDIMAALANMLNSEASKEVQEAKLKLLQRVASETEVKPSRIPAPVNITEMGGYFNLIEQVDTKNQSLKERKNEMQLSLIASALGLPV